MMMSRFGVAIRVSDVDVHKGSRARLAMHWRNRKLTALLVVRRTAEIDALSSEEKHAKAVGPACGLEEKSPPDVSIHEDSELGRINLVGRGYRLHVKNEAPRQGGQDHGTIIHSRKDDDKI